jgi:hypothetical protein
MISKGASSLCVEDIVSRVSEEALLFYYFNIQRIPCLINSPFRQDRNPSFSFYRAFNGHICFTDFATGEHGNIFTALCKLWDTTLDVVLIKINSDIKEGLVNDKQVFDNPKYSVSKNNYHRTGASKISVKVRKWKNYDLEYWNSFGIGLEALEYAEVYPVSYIFLNDKMGDPMVISADKYAYAYVERKEGNLTLKIYQPFNKKGYKWMNNNDKSVIGLWNKLPQKGEIVCICSSLKDALCLWVNTGIPSVYLQGEGYNISNHALNDLKQRFKRVCILLDNDLPGINYANKLSEHTKCENIVLETFNEGKDISDFYKAHKDIFVPTMYKLFKINKNYETSII